MSISKTLGGDRLGSGKKQKVHMHGYERSTHNLSYLWRSTMSAGTLIPFLVEVGLPGDTFDINLDADLKTHPTIGPLFGSYKVQLDLFECPIRLYIRALHNNKLGIGLNMSSVKIPTITLNAKIIDPADDPDIDNAQINPSCILSYLGIRGVGYLTDINSPEQDKSRDFNALPLLSYWDIYKNYYANKQEELGAVIHADLAANVETITSIQISTGTISQAPASSGVFITNNAGITITYAGATPVADQIIFKTIVNGVTEYVSLEQICLDPIVWSGGNFTNRYNFSQFGPRSFVNWDYSNVTGFNPIVAPRVVTFDLNQIDEMREAILGANNAVPFDVNAQNMDPYNFVLTEENGKDPKVFSQEGLAIKTYQSDLFNNWLNTEWLDGAGGISEITSVDTSGGSFSIDSLILARKVYDMLNRIAVSGGTYDDWLDTVYTEERFKKAETPMYHGGLIKELVFQEVVSNSESTGSATPVQPLGTLAGKGIMAKKHKGGKVVIKCSEPCYIIGIISLTPRVDYSQGNRWDTHLSTMDDLHKPALDQIGFQELITEQMAWWTTSKTAAGQWTTKSAGKQPAWINYMTNYNRVYGNFAIQSNEMFMTLNRRYEWNGADDITDLTTYVDPVKFNHIFANTAIDAQNFWAQIAVDMEVRRKMSAKVIPNL